MSDEVNNIKKTAGTYAKWALETRKKYIDLRLRQDPQIKALYLRLIKQLNKEITSRPLPSSASRRELRLYEISQSLKEIARQLGVELESLMQDYIEEAVEVGTSYSRNITVFLLSEASLDFQTGKMFARVNQQAVEAIWARTTSGLRVSDRIWKQSENLNLHIGNIIQGGVALGYDVNKVARMLEVYVREDAKTLTGDYPELMNRMMSRIPNNLSYEALRLARTEMSAAYGEGVIASGQVAPSYEGVKWVLSLSHPVEDICDVRAEHEEGLGEGVYKKGNEPLFPAHPNCICSLVPVHEQPEDFVKRLKDWIEDPSSQPDLETWHNDIYTKIAAWENQK